MDIGSLTLSEKKGGPVAIATTLRDMRTPLAVQAADALDAAQERIRVLERTAGQREDAAYAHGVKAALAIFYDFGLCVDQGAVDLCEKIINDRSAEIKADRAALSTARPIPEKEESNPAVPVDAIVNLVNHQQQCDEDGVMVQVSRQALCEVLAYITEVRPDNKWAARKEESK